MEYFLSKTRKAKKKIIIQATNIQQTYPVFEAKEYYNSINAVGDIIARNAATHNNSGIDVNNPPNSPEDSPEDFIRFD
uniref:Uncharacterized protein n=1 Tax=Meloidogyne enterolobii TaxID=390850 RepID=A0A6V7US43_MELEN|nr:unnamed protein product [Meloidogyne enterolobii]